MHPPPANLADHDTVSSLRLTFAHGAHRAWSHGGVGTIPPAATFGPRVLHDFEFVWVLPVGARATIDARGIWPAHPGADPGTLLLSAAAG